MTTVNNLAFTTMIPGESRVTVPFLTGVPIGSHRLCVSTLGGVPVTVDTVVNGYYVPAVQCTPPNHCY